MTAIQIAGPSSAVRGHSSTTEAPRILAAPEAPRTAARRILSPTASLALLGSIVTTALAASSAPTPLYAVYQRQWHFTPITTTVVFGIYAIAVLSALLTLGKLSDHVGRRPVLMTAIAVQIASMIIFVFADGVPTLIGARIVQGISTGGALGAIGAAMIDINRERGTFTNAVAPITGTALGGLVSGFFVQYLAWPTHLVYLALIGVLIVQLVGVRFLPETVTPKPGALASLRPEITLPRQVRRPVFIAAPVLIAVWSLAGLYGALGPALVHSITGSTSFVYGGLSLTTVAGAGAIGIAALHRTEAERLMFIGIGTLLAGLTVTVVGISSTALFFTGSAIAGIGFGAAFQGAIRTVMPLAEPHQRAGLLSLLYVVSYLALGVPAVIAGVLVVHGVSLENTARLYGLGVIVLTLVALAALVRDKLQTRALDRSVR